MSRSLHTILYGWLKELKIPASASYIRQHLNTHPDYPSLLSITDTLDELGLENTAIQIEKDQLHEMPVPFLAHLDGNGGEFVMVKNRDNLDKQFPDFFKRWGGVAIAAEQPQGWQHGLNTEWQQKDKNIQQSIVFTLAAFALFIIISAAVSFSWLQSGLLLIAVTGIFVSWLIVSKDLGIENKIADEVCGATADCNTVIHSKTATLPFEIGWSDGGIIYFSFLLVLSVIASFTQTGSGIYPVLFLLAICSLPLTFYSLYYQWQVTKKWCRLCLITVGLLWLQFIVLLMPLIAGYISLTTVNLNSIALTAFLLFTSAAAWLWVKPLLKKNKKLETENFAGKRFKNNPDVFMALLEKQRKVNTTPFEDDLQLGNPDAPLQIMVACNPYCTPCAKTHEVLHELVERNNIGLIVRFTVNTKNKEDIKLQAVEYLLRLCSGNDRLYKRKMLLEWYQLMDMEKFKLKYPSVKEEYTIKQLEFFEQWSNKTQIKFTPTIFINGFEMPKQYKADDLSGIIRTVKEQVQEQANELIEE
jgi:thiol-disulfide isomerase/thioredoxin